VIEKSALEFLSVICDGDARIALNGLQISVQSQLSKCQETEQESNDVDTPDCKVLVTIDDIKEGLQRSHVAYDRTGYTYILICYSHSFLGYDNSVSIEGYHEFDLTVYISVQNEHFLLSITYVKLMKYDLVRRYLVQEVFIIIYYTNTYTLH